MPAGVYLVAGRSEAFSCAPGPAGWRYVSDVLDLACDSAFGVVRFEVRTPGAGGSARGGRETLADGARLLVWTCSADPARERASAATSLDGGSPGMLVALVRAVAPPGTEPRRATVPVVRFDEPVLAGVEARRVVSRVSAQIHPAPDSDLLVEQWHVDDPDAGTRVVAHVAGDVVLAAEGGAAGAGVDIGLDSLASRPSPLA